MIAGAIVLSATLIHVGLFLASERIAKAIEGLATNLDNLDNGLRRR